MPKLAFNSVRPLRLSHPLNSGLVAEYSTVGQSTLTGVGSRSWLDLSYYSSTNNGVLTNGPLWYGVPPRGFSGNLNFDGVDDLVRCGSLSGSWVGSWWGVAGSAITFSCWVYPVGVLAAGDRVFMSRATNTSGTVEWFGIGMDQSNGRLRLHVVTAFTNNAAVAVSSNVWTHIVGVLPYQSTTASLYKNGTLLTTLDISAVTVNPAGGAFTIGAFRRTIAAIDSLFFGGGLDACKVYNRALSASEVYALFLDDQKPFSDRYDWSRSNLFPPRSASFVGEDEGLIYYPRSIW